MSLKFFGDVLDVRNWILVPNRPVVDGSIVLYWAVGSILLFDTEGACGVRRFQRFDVTFSVGGIRLEVDGVVVVSSR